MNRHSHLMMVFLSIVVLFGLSACASGGDEGTGAPRDPFLGGDRGVEIDFLEGSPPEEVTDEGTFDFQAVVSLENEGEFDLTRDLVSVDLVGILPEDFGVSSELLRDKPPEDDPTGRKRDAEGNIIEPIQTFVTFPDIDGFFNFHRSIAGNTEFIMRAEVCYKYQTRGLAQICVLRDLVNVEDDSVCDPSESKTVHSSAAPVRVSNFKQSVVGQDKISFSFDVVHTGNGEIFKEGDATSLPADCPEDPRERRVKDNKVLVYVDTGLNNLRCSGFEAINSGFVTLVNGRRTITCTQELDPSRQDFETDVEIALDYNYKDFEETPVLVKHLLDNS